jgi:hypothetical protein
MSTQLLEVQRSTAAQGNGRRLVATAAIAAALFVGALIGRSTAPTASSIAVRPATELSTLGESSAGDARRAEMFGVMNGLGAAPAIGLDPKAVSSSTSTRLDEMFRAMNGLRHQQI